MQRAGSSIIAGFALIASVVLHVVVVSPSLVAMLMSAGPELRQTASHPANQADLRPLPDVAPLKLGREDSAAATVTWIGHREYEEHIAELRTFEQAAFTVQPTRPTEVTQPTLAIPTETPAAARASLADVIAARPPARQFELPTMRGAIEQVYLISPRDGEGESATDGSGDADVPAASLLSVIMAGAPPAPPTPVEIDVTTPPAEPIPSEPRPGDPSDRESDPTSVVKAFDQHWKVGKPLAAFGLELLPQRPQFTDLQRVTTSLGNPLVEIAFDTFGVPKESLIIEHTGDQRADKTIVASLYRWRAKGERLGELAADDVVRVRIRIVLNPRAPH